MSKLWLKVDCGNEQSILDSLYNPNKSVTYDSDVSQNDNFSNIFSNTLNDSTTETSSNISYDSKSISYLEPLHPEKIRWFYKELKLWIPFCGYDSLRLETKYRELAFQTKITKESSKEKIVVRGDLFEVDVTKRLGFPIYWNGVDDEQESFPIIRGTWFRDTTWQPFDTESLSDEIETEHLKLYGVDVVQEVVATDGFAQQLSHKLHRNIKSLFTGGYHIDWYDQDNVFIYTDSASHFIRQKLGLTKVGSKLNRGYRTDARIEDKLPGITHLVFVIHGIGQKMKGGDIVYQVSRIRAVCRKVTKKFFPSLEGANQRVEFLPVEWRKSLILDGNTVELITPNRNKSLRNAVNSTALDILYYSSPIYRPEMIGSLRSELNRLYSMFCARSPYFEANGGKVSIIAHSLGVVLLYDILTNWSPAKIYEYLETLDVNKKDKLNHDSHMDLFTELNMTKEKVQHLELLLLTKAEQENAKRGQTNFRDANFPSNFINGDLWKVLPKLENLFCVGSPLSVFLALRGLKPQDATSMEHILPEDLCRRMFNIFHPADPVVYRMEPLINKQYANIEPVRIYRVDHPNKTPYDFEVKPNSNPDPDLLSFQNVTKDPVQREISAGSSSEVTSESPSKVNYTLAGKLAKFFKKFKADTTDNLTKTVVNKMVSNHTTNLLDDESESTPPKIKRNKKKVKTKSNSKNLETIRNNTIKSFNQSHVRLSKCASVRRSKTPSWKDIPSFNYRKSLRRLSEIQIRNDLEHYMNSSNSGVIFTPKSILSLEESSEEETLKSSNSVSNYSIDNDPDKPLIEELLVSSESLETQLKHRIDYRLPESRYESSYLSVLTSHTSYWNSPELCMFMLTHIFGHLGDVGKPL